MAIDEISELRKLLVLKTIVETGSFRQAARKLNVSTSAVSQSLSSLEKNLGKVMLIRDKSSFRVTPECTDLLSRAEEAFEALNGLLGLKQEKLVINRLDLGSYESLAMDVLSETMIQLKRDHPKAKINLITARTSVLLSKLRSGELCTALVTENDEMQNFSTILIAEDELGIYASSDCPWVKCTWHELLELDFASLSPGLEGHPIYFQKFIKSLSDSFKPTLISDSFEVIKNAAVKGAMISILPKRVAAGAGDKLIELKQRPDEKKIELGKHSIYLAFLNQCDMREAEYIAGIIRSIYFTKN